MNSSKKKKNEDLNLERDLPLSREDIEYMGRVKVNSDPDLGPYIDFLMEIGAFDGPYEKRTFYDEEFELP
ncbi:MAG: hypothetical protein DRH15_11435 [Deltaproteobacteria bacterium]|nr:MAG: hypothetical protein DRH15_11435 [Deltaproteobacteria bacterium]